MHSYHLTVSCMENRLIISHRHRFIFIRTIKTASTTVEIFLRHYCGPDDVVTPLYADEEALADPDGINSPRNYGRRILAPWKFGGKISDG